MHFDAYCIPAQNRRVDAQKISTLIEFTLRRDSADASLHDGNFALASICKSITILKKTLYQILLPTTSTGFLSWSPGLDPDAKSRRRGLLRRGPELAVALLLRLLQPADPRGAPAQRPRENARRRRHHAKFGLTLS